MGAYVIQDALKTGPYSRWTYILGLGSYSNIYGRSYFRN